MLGTGRNAQFERLVGTIEGIKRLAKFISFMKAINKTMRSHTHQHDGLELNLIPILSLDLSGNESLLAISTQTKIESVGYLDQLMSPGPRDGLVAFSSLLYLPGLLLWMFGQVNHRSTAAKINPK